MGGGPPDVDKTELPPSRRPDKIPEVQADLDAGHGKEKKSRNMKDNGYAEGILPPQPGWQGMQTHIQAIQNGVYQWKSTGCALIIICKRSRNSIFQ